MSHIYARSWSDEGFRQSLLADPAAVLKAEGVSMPANVEVVAVENDDKVFNLVIPARQAEGELSDAQLADVSGGVIGMAMIASLLAICGVGAGLMGGAGVAAGLGIAKLRSNRK